jgi:putative tricarboxylic transport membrane protein
VLAWDAGQLNRSVAYGVGPEVMPRVIAVALVGLGVASILSGLRSHEEAPGGYDRGAVLTIMGGFLALTACIGLGGGFIPAMTILFAVTAWAFGRRAPFVDAGIGFGLSVIIYLLFSKLLALSLPMGPLEKLFG